jgi:hypothetical protein
MMNPFTGSGDIGPTGIRQVGISTAVIYPLLTRFSRYSQVTIDVGQPDSAMEHKRKEERLHVSPTTTFFVFIKKCFSIFSLFSRREGGGGTKGCHAGRCRLRMSYLTSFIASWCKN